MCSAGNAKPQGGAKPWKHITPGNVKGRRDAPRELRFLKGPLPRKRFRPATPLNVACSGTPRRSVHREMGVRPKKPKAVMLRGRHGRKRAPCLGQWKATAESTLAARKRERKGVAERLEKGKAAMRDNRTSPGSPVERAPPPRKRAKAYSGVGPSLPKPKATAKGQHPEGILPSPVNRKNQG